MAITKAQQKAVAKYENKAYDKTLIRMPKGNLTVTKAHAAERGETLNGFINRAIAETMERDNAAPISEKAEKTAEGAEKEEINE